MPHKATASAQLTVPGTSVCNRILDKGTNKGHKDHTQKMHVTHTKQAPWPLGVCRQKVWACNKAKKWIRENALRLTASVHEITLRLGNMGQPCPCPESHVQLYQHGSASPRGPH